MEVENFKSLCTKNMNMFRDLLDAAFINSQLEVTEFSVKNLVPVEAEEAAFAIREQRIMDNELTEICRLCEVTFPLTKEQAERGEKYCCANCAITSWLYDSGYWHESSIARAKRHSKNN